MKRLIPAAIILVFLITICIYAHICVDNACKQTINDIENFYNQKITSSELQKNWRKRKDKMAIFVNHGFLDKISIYMGQLTLTNNNPNSSESDIIYKNIESVLSLISAEQEFALHSFY